MKLIAYPAFWDIYDRMPAIGGRFHTAEGPCHVVFHGTYDMFLDPSSPRFGGAT